MEEEIVAPRAYLISRKATPGLVQTALAAFSITPLSCVIISTMNDYPLAQQFGALILRTESDNTSLEFAMETFEQTEMPSLVISAREGIAAIHKDGRLENLPWQDQSSMLN